MTPLFFLNGNAVTLEAILYGLDIAVMLVAVMYWFKCYNHIMTSEKVLFLFGRAIPKPVPAPVHGAAVRAPFQGADQKDSSGAESYGVVRRQQLCG